MNTQNSHVAVHDTSWLCTCIGLGRYTMTLLALWVGAFASVGNQIDVFSAGEATYFCIKIPTIVLTSKSTLLAMGEARSKGGNSCSDFTGTDLVIKRSTDMGLTWSPLRVVHSENNTVIGNVAPVQLKSGRILFPFCKNNVDVLITWSDDDGLTFSDPMPLPAATKPSWKWVGLGPPAGLLLESGRVLIPSYHTTVIHGDGEISKGHTLISDDEGKTWYRKQKTYTH